MPAKPSHMASFPADYRRMNLTETVQLWEDGLRTDGAAGTFEWWYFDAHLDDGSTLVIVFYTKSIYEAGKRGFRPFASFQLESPDGWYVSKECYVPLDQFKAAKDRCDVVMGPNTFKGDLKTYTMHFEMDEVVADVTIDGTVPAWRTYTGYTAFGADDEYYFSWLPSVPQGNVAADIALAGKERRCTGIGYHDHNWGNAPMQDVLHHWYWGRGKVGDYTVITSNIWACEAYGYNEVPVFLLAKGGEVLADDSLTHLTFEASGRFIEPKTGKSNYRHLVFTYGDARKGPEWRVTYDYATVTSTSGAWWTSSPSSRGSWQSSWASTARTCAWAAPSPLRTSRPASTSASRACGRRCTSARACPRTRRLRGRGQEPIFPLVFASPSAISYNALVGLQGSATGTRGGRLWRICGWRAPRSCCARPCSTCAPPGSSAT